MAKQKQKKQKKQQQKKTKNRKKSPPKAIVSIVIPVWNVLKCTIQCIDSIFFNTNVSYELIVVNNGSTDNTAQYLKELPIRVRDIKNDRVNLVDKPIHIHNCVNIRVINNPTNLGFPKAVNQGMKISVGKYIVLLNNDTIVTPNWLSGLIEVANANSAHGLVGPITNFSSGYQQITTNYNDEESFQEFLKQLDARGGLSYEEVSRLVGFCLLIRRDVFTKVGLFDEQFGIGNYEDNDYCLRAQECGFKCIRANNVFIHHHGDRTFIENKIDFSKLMQENEAKFNAKWDIDPHKNIVVAREPIPSMEDFEYDGLHIINKILLTQNWMFRLSGSETHMSTLAIGLKDNGYDPTIMVTVCGDIATKLMDKGVHVVNRADISQFDIVQISQSQTFGLMEQPMQQLKKPVVALVHGIVPNESPTPGIISLVNHWIAVSPEVASVLYQVHNIPKDLISIIPQPIDIDKFQDKQITKPHQVHPLFARVGVVRFVWVGRVDADKIPAIIAIMEAMKLIDSVKIELSIIGDNVSQDREIDALIMQYVTELQQCGHRLHVIGARDNVEDYYNVADLVLGVGRVALEASACLAPVFIIGSNGYDGFLEMNMIQDSWLSNFSGRSLAKPLSDSEELSKELLLALDKKEQSKEVGEFVRQKFNSVDIIKMFSVVYERIFSKTMTKAGKDVEEDIIEYAACRNQDGEFVPVKPRAY